MKLLTPLQASALLSGIQLLNAVNPGRIQLQDLEKPSRGVTNRSELPGYGVRMEPARTSGQIVLLEWDAPNLYQATTTNPEPGVHAALIRELAGLQARRLVLPAPVLETTTFAAPEARPIPVPRPDDAARGRTDLASLAAAMRQADNVVLLTPGRNVFEFDLTVTDPPAGAGQESFRVLQSAAREVGSARVAPMQIAALPALPLRRLRNEYPTAAVILAAALRQSTNLEATFTGSHTAVVLGRNYPVLDTEQGRLLIDFVTITRGRDFARVAYSSVLRHEPLFDANAGDKGAWLPPAEYFRDKLVFLQPLRLMSLTSPWGAMEPMELLAYGVRTLLGSYFIHPVPPLLQTLWALTCALAVGRMVARRNPIKASWRLLMVALIAFALSLILFLNRTWLDPVFPCAAATIAFLLVTQLTFSLERAAKDRNRFLLDRFVAPEVVTELLAPIETNLGLGGRRERVAVLFADVRGFTQFAEGHSPEEVMNVVNAYLHVMTEALHLHGGILDKYTGDGLMALFRMERGVSVAQAVRGALAMRDSVLGLSADRTVGATNHSRWEFPCTWVTRSWDWSGIRNDRSTSPRSGTPSSWRPDCRRKRRGARWWSARKSMRTPDPTSI